MEKSQEVARVARDWSLRETGREVEGGISVRLMETSEWHLPAQACQCFGPLEVELSVLTF